MKKILLTLLAICLLPLGLLAGAGDVNGDGKVDVADLVELVNYRRGQASEHFNLEAADANHDGTVDDKDIEALAGQLVNGEDADFEMVVEMRDGTVYTIPITEGSPVLRYESIYMGENSRQNVIYITTSTGQTIVRCQDVKRILTRESSGNTILPPSSVSEDKTDPYDGQHVSIKLATGDSLQYNLDSSREGFRPVEREGKMVWSFLSAKIENDDRVIDEQFRLDDVEVIDFRSFEYDEVEARKALIEFYQEMDGDNWPDEYKTNWCSDRPIWEWHGVNWLTPGQNPWVNELDVQSLGLEKPRQIPNCISRMGPIKFLWLSDNNFSGSIPEFIGCNYNLLHLELGDNNLTGPFPKSFENLAKMPNFWALGISHNRFEGTLPEKFILSLMDKIPGNNLQSNRNYFTGKVPESIRNHPQFQNFWPSLLIQEGQGIDFTDLTIPAPLITAKYTDGSTMDLQEIYKKNKVTLLYKWGWWCPYSEAFNQYLVPAYKAYKDKGLEIVGFHINDDDRLADYMENHEIPWGNVLYDDWNWDANGNVNKNIEILHSIGTPLLFLVDQKGHVVFNDLMDDKGHWAGGCNRNKLFTYLEDFLGPIENDFYTSLDNSMDGVVTTFQTASTGQGIDLVFVGEGFTDIDIAGGVYDQRMSEVVEQFFLYEPYTSFRDRFNVHIVKAVSPNAEFFGNAVHAIDEDVSKAFEYASKVPNLRENAPLFVNVIYKENTGGRSYCNMLEDGSYVAFMMDGVTNVLNHEAGGHGIGKLLDEYVEYSGVALPEEAKTELETQWSTLGWGANVGWRSDPAEVKWAKFINDPRYVDEKIGVYEGSYLYQFGAYRPTENSMMRYNDMPFNAPSREAIYKRVMQESEGDGWTYDYETFVAFDGAGRRQFVDALTNASRASSRGDRPGGSKAQRQIKTRPPVFLKGTWRDALKRK